MFRVPPREALLLPAWSRGHCAAILRICGETKVIATQVVRDIDVNIAKQVVVLPTSEELLHAQSSADV
jgi:hypothetical protein